MNVRDLPRHELERLAEAYLSMGPSKKIVMGDVTLFVNGEQVATSVDVEVNLSERFIDIRKG